MAFQNSIYTTQGLGKPGTIARLNPLEAIPVVAEGDNVFAGGFVFVGTDPETQVIGPSADTAAKTADDVAGVAVFEKYQIGLTFDASLQIRAGETLAKVRRGYVYVMSTTVSEYGQKVFVNPSTGEIQTAAAAPAGFIDTGWVVETGNAAKQPCEIRK